MVEPKRQGQATNGFGSNPNMKRQKTAPKNAGPAFKPNAMGNGSQEGGSFEDDLMMMQEEEALMESNYEVELLDDRREVPTEAMKWRRPPCPVIKPETDSIAIQWIDIDMYAGPPLQVNPCKGQPLLGSSEGVVPIIRLYGVTESGNSVLIHIHGFTPYLWATCPPSMTSDQLGAFREALEARVAGNDRSLDRVASILSVEMEEKQSIYGYSFGTTRNFLKIYVKMPTIVPKVRSLLEKGFAAPGDSSRSYTTFESNVPFVLRFMIDQDITGCNWVEMPAGTYSVRRDEKKISRCQIECDVVFNNLISHSAEGRWSKIAPLRILSFDIECQGRKGHFPEAEKDPVIQIANVMATHGSAKPTIRNVFVLNTCNPIVGAQVLSFSNEKELLKKWAEFMREVDADVITGYNVANFDMKYLLDRAKTLGIENPFWFWGRIKNSKCKMQNTTFQSSAYGKSESVQTTIEGRSTFDMLPYMQRNHKLSSYSLNNVSATFLNQQKEDVHHTIISDLQEGTEEDRRRLAVYCLKDAYLPLQLMEKLSVVVNYIEMARVTGVPLDFLVTRGQQIKVLSMLLRKCRQVGLLIPVLPRESSDVTYEGATVIEPKKGYYQEPVATLDFASLYPSIMQAYNLCYSTLVAKQDVSKLSPDQYQKSPSGDYFVKATTQKGILPKILEELLAARKRAKKDMAAATDPMEKAVQNGRQLALKISANSVYGFTGATVGQLPCVPIASSVTAYGRDLLFQTKAEIERIYTVENGYPATADVVYGDTDSVMVNFGVKTVLEAMPLAEEAASKLEFEKVYYPYLLMNKKRYAGLLWTKPETHDKMDTKGLETVRRDNCLLVRQVVDQCLKKILIERDVDGAVTYAKGIISDLLQNKLDISLLVITKALGKSADADDYSSKQAHVELAARMKARDPGSAPAVGERVAYVIIEKGKGAPAYEKSEDPIYVLQNNLPIDCKYYLENQLSKPLLRIFGPILKNPESLLRGDHTLKVRKLVSTGGIMKFAQKTFTCMACKTPIYSGSSKSLCKSCSSLEGGVYMTKLEEMKHLEDQFGRLWTQCQRCQGSMHADILCTNRDCPIFYKRVKVQKDLKEVQEALDRFDW